MSDIECSKWPGFTDGVIHLAMHTCTIKSRRLGAGQL